MRPADMPTTLDHIDSWIFDLDNTLYAPSAKLFDLIDERMGAFIMRLLNVDAAHARRVQKQYFHDHGTTMAGLMRHHGVDPEDFLVDVHDIALDRLTVDARLRAGLERLPGRKLVFTNADADYAARVLDARGITDLFDGICDIRATRYTPKPDPQAYTMMISHLGIDPAKSVFVEDMARNLTRQSVGNDNRLAGQWQRKRPSRPPAGPCRFPRERHRRLARQPAFTMGNFMSTDLQTTIEAAWDARDTLGLTTTGAVREAVESALAGLDDGSFRVAERQTDGMWQVNQWLKKAVLLSFRLNDMELIEGGPGGARWWDKVPSKFAGWGENRFRDAGFRAVPGSIVRRGAFISKGAVLLPSFVNIGAYVGEGSMVDAWATVGSCAQIGANVHLSGGAGIGGVLEPLQAGPVVIEDGAFIGARAEVAEGVIVREGAVLSMGVYLGASTKIVDRATGEIFIGEVPAYSVVVPGAMPGKPLPDGSPGPSLYCAVIVKRVDAKTRAKTAINELLRD
jgi:2,3,4,5-tetrahydropyridine-2-carboxylate N-succinyltransferase